MIRGRFGALGVLAVTGVLVGHTLGYAVAHPDLVSGGHGWVLPVLGPLAPVALVVMAREAVASARSRLVGWDALVLLAAAQSAGFVGLELLEHAGTGGAIAPPFWFGLVAQPLVAVAILALVRAGADVVERLRARRPRPAARPRRRPWADRPLPRPVAGPAPIRRRGPPIVV